MDKLQYFVGKICTIITYQTTRLYSDEQHANTFTGMVDAVDGLGVWMKLLPHMTRRAFFSVPLCGIVEEEVIPVTPEQEKEIKEAYIKEHTDPIPNDLISLGGIRDKANQIRNQHGAKK